MPTLKIPDTREVTTPHVPFIRLLPSANVPLNADAVAAKPIAMFLFCLRYAFAPATNPSMGVLAFDIARATLLYASEFLLAASVPFSMDAVVSS